MHQGNLRLATGIFGSGSCATKVINSLRNVGVAMFSFENLPQHTVPLHSARCTHNVVLSTRQHLKWLELQNTSKLLNILFKTAWDNSDSVKV